MTQLVESTPSPIPLIRYALVLQICCGELSSTREGYTFHCYVLRDKEMVRG